MHVSATIGGDSLNPDFWTSYFDIVPKTSIRKGDVFLARGNKLQRRTGVWGTHSSKGKVTINDASAHAQYMIDLLNLPRPGLRNLLSKHHVGMRFFYYVNSEEENILDISDDIKDLLTSCGIDIEFDIY